MLYESRMCSDWLQQLLVHICVCPSVCVCMSGICRVTQPRPPKWTLSFQAVCVCVCVWSIHLCLRWFLFNLWPLWPLSLSPASSCDQEQQSAQEEARQHKNDAVFVPDCAQGGLYKPVQCHPSTGYCWCVLVDTGRPIPGTSTRWERVHLYTAYVLYFHPNLQRFLEFIAQFFVANKPDSC